MKNNMKKIIIGIFVFASVLVARNVSAAGGWNEASNDCLPMSVVNATTNEGYVHPCWPLKAVSANNGQVANVRIYYHNTNFLKQIKCI